VYIGMYSTDEYRGTLKEASIGAGVKEFLNAASPKQPRVLGVVKSR
jgi:hypothetical protein